jgi:hypothetical protein
MKAVCTLTFLFFAFCLPAQTLIPFQGYKDLFGYATEDGQVVIEPKHKGIFEILPADRFYTVLRHNGPLQALTRRGELVPLENRHDVVTEVENVRPYARQIDTLRRLVAIKKSGTMLTLRNTRTGAQTEWYNPTRNNNLRLAASQVLVEAGGAGPAAIYRRGAAGLDIGHDPELYRHGYEAVFRPRFRRRYRGRCGVFHRGGGA